MEWHIDKHATVSRASTYTVIALFISGFGKFVAELHTKSSRSYLANFKRFMCIVVIINTSDGPCVALRCTECTARHASAYTIRTNFARHLNAPSMRQEQSVSLKFPMKFCCVCCRIVISIYSRYRMSADKYSYTYNALSLSTMYNTNV